MRLLLDTHVLIWWHEKSNKLGKKLRHLIQNSDISYVSMASLWEMAVKLSLGKIKLNVPFEEKIIMQDFEILDMTFRHAQQMAKLPFHHRDPFDRILIAQALAEDLHFVTDDAAILRYDIKRVEV